MARARFVTMLTMRVKAKVGVRTMSRNWVTSGVSIRVRFKARVRDWARNVLGLG
jgi:hypothetical protein